MGPSLVVVGVDIGQKQDPTAVVVCERETRELEPARWELPSRVGLFEGGDARRIPARTEQVYVGRHLGRLPLGTPYPEVARHVAGVVEALVRRGVQRPRLMVDATGVGMPVVDLLAEALGKMRARDLIAATFTHGDRYQQTDEYGRKVSTASVGKAYLVSRLQALLQTARLQLPITPESTVLARELQDYEIRVDEDANDKYGAFKVGTHDDLVTALGLAVCYQEPRGGKLYTGDGISGRLYPVTFGE